MHRHHDTAAAPRDRAFWIAASVLVLGQLVALWMVCSQQVRMAQVRQASAQAERLAVADCLRSVPNATIGSCTARTASRGNQLATAGLPARDASVTPVDYVYR